MARMKSTGISYANTKKKHRRVRRKRTKRIFTFVFLMAFIVTAAMHFLQNDGDFNLFASDPEINRDFGNTYYQNLTTPKTYSDEEIHSTLFELSKTSKEYKEIYENMNQYPTKLLAALCSNPEMLEFALGYLKAEGSATGEFTKQEKQEDYPLLLQWDKRWGYASYGENCLGLSGCAPTCISMVALALTGDEEATPDQVAAYAEREGYYMAGTGTLWTFMTEGASHFGIKGRELSLNKSVIFDELESGHPIICSMAPGDFTTQGHFIVLIGLRDGKIIVNDPNSKERSCVLWDYDILSAQTKNLWVYNK